ncbi:MAG TPA: hypothetical protein VLA13_06555, partial [Massilibacterium sp.]|nr:hypothetical protein [Massilibacterium sp.]
MNKLTDEEIKRLIELHDKESGNLEKQSNRLCWDSGIKIVKNCDCVAKMQYEILFYPIAHSKIQKLQEMFPTLEWLAYLEGKIDHETKKVYVKDLIIP